jgi:hypothetical protein
MEFKIFFLFEGQINKKNTNVLKLSLELLQFWCQFLNLSSIFANKQLLKSSILPSFYSSSAEFFFSKVIK